MEHQQQQHHQHQHQHQQQAMEMPSVSAGYYMQESTDFREKESSTNPIIPASGDRAQGGEGTEREYGDGDAHDQLEAQREGEESSGGGGGDGGGGGGGGGGRTRDQATRLLVVQWTLALVGVRLKGPSPCGARTLQLFAILCQLGNLSSIGWSIFFVSESDEVSATAIDRYDIEMCLLALIMLAPLGFLHYVTFSEEHSAVFLAAVETVTLKRWHVVLPMVPPLGTGLTCAFAYGVAYSPLWGFIQCLYFVIAYLPAAVGIMVCFVHAQSFTDKMPRNKSLEELKEPLVRHKERTQRCINFLNKTFVLPNIALWVFTTMVFLWFLIDSITKWDSEYTSDAVNYAVALVEQHCGDSTNVGYFHWLDKLQLGWTLLSVQVNRRIIARIFYVLIIAAMTGGSRYLTL